MSVLFIEPIYGYNSMTRITNTILSLSIPNPQYKIYLNGRLTLTLITPNRPSHCVSWNGPFPFYMKFEKIQNRQKYHHSLKEHPVFSKIAKFGCDML